MLTDGGYKVWYDIVNGWWFDTGKASDILMVNAIILDEGARREIKGKIVNSKVEGRVKIVRKPP